MRILAFPLILFTLPVLAQVDCSFSLGQDTMLCQGQVRLLQRPAGASSWMWGNGATAQMVSTDSTGWYICTATFVDTAANAVVNGDFSAGNVGFTTGLNLGTSGSYGPLSAEGTYLVTTAGNLAHTNFQPCTDHTGGGNMMVVNGSGVAGAPVWCQNVSVQPSTEYAFSAWVATMVSEAPAIMDFTVDGVSLGEPLLAAFETCIWSGFTASWYSGPTATTANICITNQNLAPSGNDFALDDIAFVPVCSYTDSMHVTLLPAAPTVSVVGDTAFCTGSSVELSAIIDVEHWPWGMPSLTWNTGETTAVVEVDSTGVFSVVADGPCLHSTAGIHVEAVGCGGSLTMPNVFSPNGDGVNDHFGPIVHGKPENYRLEIRNRWGQLLYHTTDLGARWDGRAEGGWLPAGTYYWVVRYTELLAEGVRKEREEAGHVTLLDAR